MKNERLSQLLFFAATAVALLVYWLTAPATLPWGLEAKMAGADDSRLGGEDGRRAVAADKNLRIARRTLGEILDKRRKGMKKGGGK